MNYNYPELIKHFKSLQRQSAISIMKAVAAGGMTNEEGQKLLGQAKAILTILEGQQMLAEVSEEMTAK